MTPKVSIVTITYNSSRFVRQAIESVLAQSFTDFEYLISDDCSTDNTWEIIQEYKDSRIRAWRNETNLGEYPNRNKTLNEAKGEYIIWIDGDDIFYPHGLEFMVRMLDAFPKSAMACAFESLQYFIYPYEFTPEEIYKHEFLGFPILQTGFTDTIFKTNILKSINGFPIKYIAGDTYTKRLIAQTNNVLLISKDVSWWRITKQQASQKLKSLEAGIIAFESVMDLLSKPSLPIDKETKYSIIENQKISLLHQIFHLGVKKGKILLSFTTLCKFRLTEFHILFKKIKRDYSQTKAINGPLILPFNKNPYSANYKKEIS